MANSVFLSAFGGMTFNGSQTAFSFPVLLPSGLVTAPSLSFSADPATGVYLFGVSQLGFSSAGVAYAAVTGNGLEIRTGTQIRFGTIGGAETLHLTDNNVAGQLNIQQTGSVGIGFDVTTNAVLKVRTIAQTGYATVDALGYKVSGVAGVAAFGPAAVASITVVNGLITAIS